MMKDLYNCSIYFLAVYAHKKEVTLCSVFNQLLDDAPLPVNEVSSSVLVASYSHTSLQNGKGAIGGSKPSVNGEVEKGLLTLIYSDTPGLQVSFLIALCKLCLFITLGAIIRCIGYTLLSNFFGS